MRKFIVAVLVVLFSATSAAFAGPPSGVEVKPSGVMVVGGDALAAPNTPAAAVAYALAQVNK